jgi:hypothetical protein
VFMISHGAFLVYLFSRLVYLPILLQIDSAVKCC